MLRLSINTDVSCAEQIIKVDFLSFGGRSLFVPISSEGTDLSAPEDVAFMS